MVGHAGGKRMTEHGGQDAHNCLARKCSSRWYTPDPNLPILPLPTVSNLYCGQKQPTRSVDARRMRGGGGGHSDHHHPNLKLSFTGTVGHQHASGDSNAVVRPRPGARRHD